MTQSNTLCLPDYKKTWLTGQTGLGIGPFILNSNFCPFTFWYGWVLNHLGWGHLIPWLCRFFLLSFPQLQQSLAIAVQNLPWQASAVNWDGGATTAPKNSKKDLQLRKVRASCVLFSFQTQHHCTYFTNLATQLRKFKWIGWEGSKEMLHKSFASPNPPACWSLWCTRVQQILHYQ